MTKKRKISYRELLSQQEGGAAPTPPAVPAPSAAPPPAPPSRGRTPRELAAVLNAGRDEVANAPAGRPTPRAVPVVTQPPVSAASTPVPPAMTVAESRAPSAESRERRSRSFRARVDARADSAQLLLFHVGAERFALPLEAVEETVELATVSRIPEMPPTMLGVFDLRGHLTPLYSPAGALGVPLATEHAATLIIRTGGRRIGVAVDDVDDVLEIALDAVRPAPGVDDPDGVLLGVVRRGREFVAVIDPDALTSACLADRAMETA